MNSKRGVIAFEVDGEQHKIALTTNAMVVYQDVAGETLLHGLGELQKDPSDMRRVRRMFWAGLSSQVPDITENDAGDIMDTIGIMQAVDLLSQASNAAFPEAESGNVKPAKSRKPKAT